MSRREERLQIPRENADLRAYVQRKRLKVWLITLAWELFWTVVFVYYFQRDHRKFNFRFAVVLGLFWIFGLFLFGWVQMLFDRSWQGTIVRIDYKDVMMMDSLTRGRRLTQQMWLHIVEENGRKHKITLVKKRNFERYYHVGDKIVHHSGLPYPESNDGADQHLCVCSLCGGVELTETDHCHGCGATLIRPERSRYAKKERVF